MRNRMSQAKHRLLLFTAAALVMMAMAVTACDSDTAPVPTATPTVLELAEATLRSALDPISRGLISELTETVADVVCQVDAGEFAPSLTIESVTDSLGIQLAVRGFCIARQ